MPGLTEYEDIESYRSSLTDTVLSDIQRKSAQALGVMLSGGSQSAFPGSYADPSFLADEK